VTLPKGKLLHEAGDAVQHAYFPTDGLLSLLVITPNGEALEVAMVGSEGFIGLPILLHSDTTSFRIVAQLSTPTLRIRAEEIMLALEEPRGISANNILPARVLALGAAETVVGISDAFKPYPERRGLYRPNLARTSRAGVIAMMPQAVRAVASAAG